jgi:hypothetical protein
VKGTLASVKKKWRSLTWPIRTVGGEAAGSQQGRKAHPRAQYCQYIQVEGVKATSVERFVFGVKNVDRKKPEWNSTDRRQLVAPGIRS